MYNGQVTIKVVVTKPMGTSCRKLIYNAGLVAEKLGINMDITDITCLDRKIDDHILPPFILIDDMIVGKNTGPERLEKIIRDITNHNN